MLWVLFMYPCGVGMVWAGCDVSGGVLDCIVDVMELCIVYVSMECGPAVM